MVKGHLGRVMEGSIPVTSDISHWWLPRSAAPKRPPRNQLLVVKLSSLGVSEMGYNRGMAIKAWRFHIAMEHHQFWVNHHIYPWQT